MLVSLHHQIKFQKFRACAPSAALPQNPLTRTCSQRHVVYICTYILVTRYCTTSSLVRGPVSFLAIPVTVRNSVATSTLLQSVWLLTTRSTSISDDNQRFEAFWLVFMVFTYALMPWPVSLLAIPITVRNSAAASTLLQSVWLLTTRSTSISDDNRRFEAFWLVFMVFTYALMPWPVSLLAIPVTIRRLPAPHTVH